MDAALVGGCAVAGLTAGLILDEVAAHIAPARPLSEVAEPAAASAQSAVAAIAPGEPVVAVRPVPGPPKAAERVAVSLVAALAFALAAARLGAQPELAAYCALFGGLVAVSVADLRVGLVPRVLLYPTFALMAAGLVAAAAVDERWRPLEHAAIGGAGAFVVFFALWWCYPRGIGFGDVRLAGVLGAGLGWIGFGALYIGFAAAFLLGVVLGLVLMLRHGTGRKTRLAFGPPLALGATIGVLWGTWLVHAWTTHP
ncbi:MAG TPA: A24 family peptidase [Acidimicrobiales bacterium]|nr:A24 family peptidase [Acidimicrobiales bacterium]